MDESTLDYRIILISARHSRIGNFLLNFYDLVVDYGGFIIEVIV